MQHTCSEWREENFNHYHGYLISESHDLPGVIASAHEDSTALGSKKAAGIGEKVWTSGRRTPMEMR